MINFWSGNKTEIRREYEREVLLAALAATAEQYGAWQLHEVNADYPDAAEEAAVFRRKGHDLFVTVAGNEKLADEEKIVVPLPLMKGLLGYRLLIINAGDQRRFSAIGSAQALRRLRNGIPATWADAGLFRKNGYTVVERGNFDELFDRLKSGEFDYVTFGANEINSVFESRAEPLGGLIIEPSLLMYYPFALVFYVNPALPELAQRLCAGLQNIQENNTLEKIFARYYGDIVTKLKLRERRLITLENPALPESLKWMTADLLDPPPAKKS